MVAPLILVEDQHTKYRVADYICKLAIIDFAFHSWGPESAGTLHFMVLELNNYRR